ncbi:MAG TPA: GFA family protein [Cedecea sp.]
MLTHQRGKEFILANWKMPMLECKGSCLCGKIKFNILFPALDVIACHGNACQKWSGGIALYIASADEPDFCGESKPAIFTYSHTERRAFCPACGGSLYYHIVDKKRFLISYPSLLLSKNQASQLLLAAEVYIENKPPFCGLTGQYTRLTGQDFLETKLMSTWEKPDNT